MVVGAIVARVSAGGIASGGLNSACCCCCGIAVSDNDSKSWASLSSDEPQNRCVFLLAASLGRARSSRSLPLFVHQCNLHCRAANCPATFPLGSAAENEAKATKFLVLVHVFVDEQSSARAI